MLSDPRNHTIPFSHVAGIGHGKSIIAMPKLQPLNDIPLLVTNRAMLQSPRPDCGRVYFPPRTWHCTYGSQVRQRCYRRFIGAVVYY